MTEEIISRTKIAWLAGIIDGEGSIEAGWTNQYNTKKDKILSKHLYCRIKVGNTDPRMIAGISEVYKLIDAKFNYRTYKTRHDRSSWMMDISSSGKGSIRKILLAIYPYVVNKRDQVQKLLEIIDYRESLGYRGGWQSIEGDRHNGFHKDPNWKPLEQDEKLNRLIQELRDFKRNLPLPSETTRIANRILVLKG